MPKTCSNRPKIKQRKKKNICEYLYSKNAEIETQRANIKKANYNSEKQLSEANHTLSKSEEIYTNLIVSSLDTIYNYLDPDGLGKANIRSNNLKSKFE